jgi:hypothetical protein
MSDSINPINRLPTSHNELRAKYLDGRKSITSYLPIPEVKMIKHHSYISVNECILDFLLKTESKIMTLDDWKSFYDSDTYDRNNLTIMHTDRIKEIVSKAIEQSVEGTMGVPLFF